jgi:ribosomal protein S14
MESAACTGRRAQPQPQHRRSVGRVGSGRSVGHPVARRFEISRARVREYIHTARDGWMVTTTTEGDAGRVCFVRGVYRRRVGGA